MISLLSALLVAVVISSIAYAASGGGDPAKAQPRQANDQPVGKPASALESMSVFSGTPERGVRVDPSHSAAPGSTIRDIVKVLTEDAAGVPTDWLPGSALLDQGLLLQTDLGLGNHAIYAFPTAKGRVCAGLTGQGGGCYGEFIQPILWTIGKPDSQPLGSGEPVVVWGLARDDVVEVSITVDGETRNAHVTNNSFFFQLSDNRTPDVAIKELMAVMVDGTTHRIPMSLPPHVSA